MRQISDAERRNRIAVRHGLAGPHRHRDLTAAVQAMTVLHATTPSSVHLAAWARVSSLTLAEVDAALYQGRTLVKQLAMRRTLFGFGRELLPYAVGSAAARVAGTEARRLIRDVERCGLSSDGAAWLAAAEARILAALTESGGMDAATLREQVLGDRILQGSGAWMVEAAAAPRVLTVLGARGLVMRGANAGSWRGSRPTWVTTSDWLGGPVAVVSAAEGYAELVRRWLWTFGPGTEDDIAWWLGATRTAVRAALVAVEAQQCSLERGEVGYLLPGDDEPTATPEPWAALLPELDPTTMGWKARDHYLDPTDKPYLFDSAGNAVTTAWWNGRIIGSWLQNDTGAVELILRHDPGPTARAALEAEAHRVTTWLDGDRVASVHATPLRQARPLA